MAVVVSSCLLEVSDNGSRAAPSREHMKEKEGKNFRTSRLGLEVPEVLLPDIDDQPSLQKKTQACYRARKPQNPENTKKKYTKSPTPGRPPENTEKLPKKKITKTAQKRPFLGRFVFFFGFFFRIFRSGGRPGVGDFVYFFSYFRDSGVFGLCSRPAGSQA